MIEKERETYKKYIKEFDPSLEDKYIESLVEFLYKKTNLHIDKIGLWIAYKNCHEEIRHGRIESKKDNDTFIIKKKNGDINFVKIEDILGICQKPTKTNKNPEIKPFEDV